MDYQPLGEFNSTGLPQALSSENGRRCKSASHTVQSSLDPVFTLKRTLLDGDCISLPGQINLDTVSDNATGERAESMAQNENSNSNTTPVMRNGECNSAGNFKEAISVSANKNFNMQQEGSIVQTSCRESDKLNVLQCEGPPCANNNECVQKQHVEISSSRSTDCIGKNTSEGDKCFKCNQNNDIQEGECFLSQANINVSQHLGSQYRLKSFIINNDATEHDYLSSSSSDYSIAALSLSQSAIEQYKQKEPIQYSGSVTRPITLALYFLCAILVYPIFLILIPFLLAFKLVSLLCCCIPCRRRRQHRAQTTSRRDFPLFFNSRLGGYHTIAIELKEQMDGDTFVEYVIAKLNDVYCRENTIEQSVVFRLASVVRWIACFSWWELGENVNLEDHIQIINKKIATTLNFTDFIEQLSKNESPRVRRSRKKLWQLYYFPFFKTKSSSVLLKVHHSVLSGVNLKELLLYVSSDSPKTESCKATQCIADMPLSQPNFFETLLTAPGVVLKHILRPSLSLLLNSNKLRYAYSAPMHLSEACHLANKCDISLHSLFMAPLSQTLRNLFPQKYPFGRVNVAMPVTDSSGHNSAFFVNLPLTKQTWDITRFQQLNRDIYYSSKDSHVLLSAAKLSSLTLSPCTVDFITSSIVRGADVLFHVVHCPNTPHYLEDYAVSSVMYWPPLFDRVSMSVCVVVYDKSVRVCVATDYSVTEWPDILVKHYVSNYVELYRSFCT